MRSSERTDRLERKIKLTDSYRIICPPRIIYGDKAAHTWGAPVTPFCQDANRSQRDKIKLLQFTRDYQAFIAYKRTECL